MQGKSCVRGAYSMKKIWGYLRDYFRDQCNYRYLAALMLLLAAGIYLNFFVKSEDVWIKADPISARRLLKYLGGYLAVFGGAYALQMVFDRDKALRSPRSFMRLCWPMSRSIASSRISAASPI